MHQLRVPVFAKNFMLRISLHRKRRSPTLCSGIADPFPLRADNLGSHSYIGLRISMLDLSSIFIPQNKLTHHKVSLGYIC